MDFDIESKNTVIEIPIYKLNRTMRFIISILMVIIFCITEFLLLPITGRGIYMAIIVPAGISALLISFRASVLMTCISAVFTIYLHFINGFTAAPLYTLFLPGLTITFAFSYFISKWVTMMITFRTETESREEINKALERKNEELKLYMERLETEIEDRYHAERILAKSEEQYRNLVEKARIGIIIDDCEGNFTYFNRQFLELLELKEDSSHKFTIMDLVHPDDYDRVIGFHKDRIMGKVVPERYVFRVIKNSGLPTYFEVDSVALKENGIVVGTRSYIWDVTEKKLAELALSASEERFRSVFDAAPFGIYRINVDGTFVMANKSFLNMIGVDAFSLIEGKQLNELFDNSDNREEFFNKLFNDKIIIDYENEWSCLNGSYFIARENAWLILNERGEAVYADGFVEDITARKQAEEERASLMGQLLSAKSEIKILSGLLPICSTCKKIRNDDGSWDQMESYIDDHSEAEFSHGICPDCAKKLYPSLNL